MSVDIPKKEAKWRNRKSAPSLTMSFDDLVSNVSSNSSNVSSEQLKQLSQSPMSKRLHISNVGESSKYVIPIPFTLQLPPKLSQKSPAQPQSPGKRVTLVYTGTKYEKLEENDTESNYNFKGSISVVPPVPPLPPRPRRKSDTFRTNRPKFLSADELSVLEEMSNSQAGSRHPSFHEPFDRQQRILSTGSVSTFSSISDAVSYSEAISSMQPTPLYEFKDGGFKDSYEDISTDCDSFSNSVDFEVGKRSQIQERALEKPLPNPHPEYSSDSSCASFSDDLDSPMTPQNMAQSIEKEQELPRRYHGPSPSMSMMNLGQAEYSRPPVKSHTMVELYSPLVSQSNLATPTNSSPKYELNNSRPALPAFSTPQNTRDPILSEKDSIVAELKNCKKQLAEHRPVEKANPRISSLSSEISYSSTSSWNSIQKSIDITIAEEPVYVRREKSLPPTPHNDSDWVETETEDSSGSIQPLRISRASTAVGVQRQSTLPTLNLSTFSVSPASQTDKDKDTVDESSISVPSPLRNQQSTFLPPPKIGHPDSSYDTSTGIPDYYFDDNESVSTANYSEVTTSTRSKIVKSSVYEKPRIVSDSDNEGSGKRFSFPNKDTPCVSRKPPMPSRTSFHSFIDDQGQIEIPDLDDESVAKYYASSHSAYSNPHLDGFFSESESELEPVGVPSRASKSFFRESLRPYHGSDSEDSTTTFSSHTRSKSSPNLHKKVSPSKSPVRHQRHKSMYSIDFDIGSIASSHPSTVIRSNYSSTVPAGPKPTPRPSQKMAAKSPTKNASNKMAAKLSHIAENRHYSLPEQMNIVVAKPPRPVNYAVDFKEASARDEEPPFNSMAPTINCMGKTSFAAPDDRRVMEMTRQLNSLKVFQSSTTGSATSNSSYKNSLGTHAESNSSHSDAESVVIDLTKEGYDVCMVNRMNSTSSYRSVIEKAQNGREVEVVLVDDEDTGSDLSSLYSKYRHNEYVFREQYQTVASQRRATQRQGMSRARSLSKAKLCELR